MERYIEELPLVIRNCIKGLRGDKRQAILIFLLRKGPKSFTEICKEFDISKSNLSHHLKVLLRYGLLYNYYIKNAFKDKYSFYKISKLGEYLINSLKEMVKPAEIISMTPHILYPSIESEWGGFSGSYKVECGIRKTSKVFTFVTAFVGSGDVKCFYLEENLPKKNIMRADSDFINESSYVMES